ncbi:MAG: hypothetical protein MJK04_37790 [Psychrosphaera sp.]|nr:hypothetical protein [Psychrosphaera sp.]
MIGVNARLITGDSNRVFVNGRPLFDEFGQLNKVDYHSGFTLRFGHKAACLFEAANESANDSSFTSNADNHQSS